MLCRRTREEGFGHFAESGFRTYPPYLEKCVSYDPTQHDLGQLCELLRNTARWSRLISFASERFAQGYVDQAQTAFQYAIDSGNDYYAADATITLGKLLAQKQDYDGARTAFQRATESHNVYQASRAAFYLGKLYAEHGHVAEARASFQRVIDLGEAGQVPRAAVELGTLLASQERTDLVHPGADDDP
jgi:tetratricopeptide (TPR) repeat protein